MTLEARKQERENSQSLLRRFTKKVKRSGVLVRARKNRFRKRIKSKPMKQKAALRRVGLREKYQRLQKLGELKER